MGALYIGGRSLTEYKGFDSGRRLTMPEPVCLRGGISKPTTWKGQGPKIYHPITRIKAELQHSDSAVSNGKKKAKCISFPLWRNPPGRCCMGD